MFVKFQNPKQTLPLTTELENIPVLEHFLDVI